MPALRPPALNDVAALLPAFPAAEVVVVGDFVADEYVYGETERISREAPVLIVRYESSELKAGGAGNAAQNLAALGVRVRAVGVVGDDALGTALLDELEGGGIDVGGMLRVKGRATEAKTRILAGGRSTRRQQMLRLDRAARDPLPAAVVRKLARQVGRAGRGAGAVLASDYGSGVVGPEVIEALQRVHRARRPGLRRLALRADPVQGAHHGEAQRGGAGGGQRPLAGRARRPGARRPRAAPQGGAARCCW